MDRYLIHMAYDGTSYHGWQVQPNGITVQEVLEDALSTLLKTEISVTGAGRTDTGVHASCFYAHFDLASLPDTSGNPEIQAPLHPDFVFRLNRFLPGDIVVYGIRQVEPQMHARFSAVSRTYEYHISTLKPLFNRQYSLYIYGKLDLDEIRKCCAIIRKTEDFTSFSRLHTDVRSNICKIELADWRELDNGYLFSIRADRFLRNMVRSLTGTLLDAGQGKLNSKSFQVIVDSKDRNAAGQSAPAHGLFLTDIRY